MLVIPTAADSGSLLSQRLTKPVFPLGTTLRNIQDRGTIRVSINPDTTGFCKPNAKTGRLEGIDVMIARRMAQGIFGGTMIEARPHVEIVEANMGERLPRVIDGEADIVVAALAATKSRRKIADFTGAYYGTALTVVVRKDLDVQAVSELKKLPVAMVDGSADVDFAMANDLAGEIVLARSNTEMAEMLARGEVGAALAASVHLDAYSSIWAESSKRLPVEFDSYQYAVAVRKGDEALREFLDVQMTDIIRQGYVAIAAACAPKEQRNTTVDLTASDPVVATA